MTTTETRGIKIALVAYIVIFTFQLVFYFLTNILVLLAQALEVLSDVFISAFLLLSMKWSQKPADQFHMFGHGRAQNVAALVSAIFFISFIGVEVFRQAISKFFQHDSSEFQNTNFALIIIIFSMFVLIIPIIYILRVKGRGSSVKAQLVSLFKDEISYIPALIGIVLISKGYFIADPITSIIIGIVIVLGGIFLFKDNVHYLLGKAPSKKFMERIISTVKSVKGVLGIHDLKAEYVGPNIVHTGFHIEVAKNTSIEEADRISHEVEKRVNLETGCHYCVIHVDPVD